MVDKETVDKILDAADIVDVVSDFVHLRRRGSNYVGLCPFTMKRRPPSAFPDQKASANVSVAARVAVQSISLWSTSRCRIMRH